MSNLSYPVGTVVKRPEEGPITVLLGDAEFEVPVTEEELALAVPAEKLVLVLDETGYHVANSIIQQSFRKDELKKRLEAEEAAQLAAKEAESKRLARRLRLVDSYFELYEMVSTAAPKELTPDLVKDITTSLHIECMRNRL